MNVMHLAVMALVAPLLAGTASAEEESAFHDDFTRACIEGPLIEVLLSRSFTAEKTRRNFCGCFLEGIGSLDEPEQQFVVRTMDNLESNAGDRERFDATGQRLEAAFDGCVASEGLAPLRD